MNQSLSRSAFLALGVPTCSFWTSVTVMLGSVCLIANVGVKIWFDLVDHSHFACPSVSRIRNSCTCRVLDCSPSLQKYAWRRKSHWICSPVCLEICRLLQSTCRSSVRTTSRCCTSGFASVLWNDYPAPLGIHREYMEVQFDNNAEYCNTSRSMMMKII